MNQFEYLAWVMDIGYRLGAGEPPLLQPGELDERDRVMQEAWEEEIREETSGARGAE